MNRKMTVQGFDVAPGQLAGLLGRMKEGAFSVTEIEALAKANGIPSKGDIAIRLAERLIRREEKAGNIMPSGQIWLWVGEKEWDVAPIPQTIGRYMIR
ncbi:MAG: hypothetical protein V4805_17115 [Pseudomonadota bacterium]